MMRNSQAAIGRATDPHRQLRVEGLCAQLPRRRPAVSDRAHEVVQLSEAEEHLGVGVVGGGWGWLEVGGCEVVEGGWGGGGGWEMVVRAEEWTSGRGMALDSKLCDEAVDGRDTAWPRSLRGRS